MTIDKYTKVVLTAIAAALVSIAVQDYVAPVQAQTGQAVYVTNWRDMVRSFETDYSSGPTLRVQCVNC